MAISSDLNRVFEVGPVFRAEKSSAFVPRAVCCAAQVCVIGACVRACVRACLRARARARACVHVAQHLVLPVRHSCLVRMADTRRHLCEFTGLDLEMAIQVRTAAAAAASLRLLYGWYEYEDLAALCLLVVTPNG